MLINEFELTSQSWECDTKIVIKADDLTINAEIDDEQLARLTYALIERLTDRCHFDYSIVKELRDNAFKLVNHMARELEVDISDLR